MKIEFLYFPECPAYQSALNLLEQLLKANDISTAIEKIEITSPESAVRYRFLGSPSIRINGVDIEGQEEASEYGLKCRIYRDTGSVFPSETMLIKVMEQSASHQ